LKELRGPTDETENRKTIEVFPISTQKKSGGAIAVSPGTVWFCLLIFGKDMKNV
jgi:hypothetical protein